VSRLLATFAVIWRLAHPYFFSEDRRAGRILLASVILIELSLVAINVMLNRWQNAFYQALQDRAWDAFVNQVFVFLLLGGPMWCWRSTSSTSSSGCKSGGARG
jgi:putative ATP-binding cassette transporter